ncbi:hypothetical protein, partial [Paraclostridium dentum]|uniref:hypothetical protein n=1 Tax=Paraclostridium dentum TaxID=2662455 RepID=UPI003F419A6D
MNINNTEFNSKHQPHLFTLENGKVMFRLDSDMSRENISIYAYMKNQYGIGGKSQTYLFDLKAPIENVTEGNMITVSSIKEVQELFATLSKVYGVVYEPTIINKSNIYSAKIYNECADFLKAVNNSINNIISNSTFD